MNYSTGERIKVGDRVTMGGGKKGVVLRDFDDSQFAQPALDRAAGAFDTGVLIQPEGAALVYYAQADADLVLVERAPTVKK